MSAPQKSRWGSFLSSAVAGVEARLDNILAEDDPNNPSRSLPATNNTAAVASTPTPPPRSATPSRLQERLAKAVAAKNASQRSSFSATEPRVSADYGSASPSHSSRPSLDASAVNSPEQPPAATPKISISADEPSAESVPTSEENEQLPTTSAESKPTADTPRSSLHSDRPTRIEDPAVDSLARDTAMSAEGALSTLDLYQKRVQDLEKALQETQAQHQDELHSHVERADALQAKLQYFAREAEENARSAAAAAPAGSLEKKLAEKDQQIAQLMEEGQKLSNNEQKHRTIIKKIRAQLTANEKELNEQKIWRQKAEVELSHLRTRSREMVDLEKANQDSHRLTSKLEKALDKLRADLAARDSTISSLKRELQAESNRANSTAAKANDQLVEASQKRVKELEDTVAALKVEKDLASDRAKAQAAELREKADKAAERSRAVELDLKGEIQALETKLEVFRVRAEETSSGAIGDAQAKLLRQIETLQTQYAVASENWQGIEASLVARASNLERERDEALRRESEMRKKARETVSCLTKKCPYTSMLKLIHSSGFPG